MLGLSKSSVQSILKRHDIEKVLAQEGGRTSRGSIKNMRAYVGFLNDFHGHGESTPQHGATDIATIEEYWIERVKDFFPANRSGFGWTRLMACVALCAIFWIRQKVGRRNRPE